MTEIISNCPRCHAKKITFDLMYDFELLGNDGKWNHFLEAFCVCRACNKSTIFLLFATSLPARQNKTLASKHTQSVGNHCDFRGFIHIGTGEERVPPRHLPKHIEQAFLEGAKCKSIHCNNASISMYRLCVDLATKDLLPKDDKDENNPTKREKNVLAERLNWLFRNQILPNELKELSKCIREDGNDAVHDGSLGDAECEDIEDFTFILLERMFTIPERIKIAENRRGERRNSEVSNS